MKIFQILTYKINLPRSIIYYDIKKKKRKIDKVKRVKRKQSQLKKWRSIRRRINKNLRVGRIIAKWVIRPENKYRSITTRHTKHLGKIHSDINNQIINKYKNNKKIKNVKSVNLIVPGKYTQKHSNVRYDNDKGILTIVPLKLELKWTCPIPFIKINQVEVNNKYVYVCLTTTVEEKKNYQKMIGVDLNIKHNLATVGEPEKGDYKYLGKNYIYEKIKFREIRRRYQKQGKNKTLKRFGNKEQRTMNDLNHKLSRQILQFALKRKGNIAMEDLTGIRKARSSKSFRYFLNSWQFYKLRKFVEYKSQAAGIKTVFVDPRFTSQDCSRCGERNRPRGKKYTCQHCNLEIHRDKNACFNISNRGFQSLVSSD